MTLKNAGGSRRAFW